MFDRHCPLKQAAKASALFGSLRFSELDALADTMVKTLQDKGVGDGDRIAVLYPSSPELAALFFATWRIGATICPLSLRLPKAQIPHALARIKPCLFIDAFPMNHPIRSSMHPMQAPGLLLFTSGSSGTPKLAFLSLIALLENALPAISFLQIQEKSRYLLNLPLYHVGGIGALLRCILAQASCTFDASDLAITHISMVPTQLYRSTPIYPQLKCLLLGGAPIAHYPARLPCYLSYGLTEMGALVSAAFCPEDPACTGHPLPGRKVRLSPDGEILVQGKSLFEGYWEEGRLFRPLQEEGWFPTRDVGSYGSNGLTILGRKDWQFISGGENIQPEEIEQQLLLLPGVIEAAVIGIEDLEFGQRPGACICVADPFLTKEKIHSMLLERLPKFKVPKFYAILSQMPKNGLKIDRQLCKKILLNTS